MKKITLIILLFTGLMAHAQYVDGKPLSEIDKEFVQIWISQSKSGSQVYVDVGQERKYLYGKNNLTNLEGKDIETLSHVPLINKMILLGYDVVDVASLKKDNVNTLLYSFRKKVKTRH